MMYDTDFLVGKMPINLDKINELGLAVAIENDFAIIFLDQSHLFHSSIKFNQMKYHSDNEKMGFGGDLIHFFAKEIALHDYVILNLKNYSSSFYGEFYQDAQKVAEGEDLNDLLRKLGVKISDKKDEFNQLNFKEYKTAYCFYQVGKEEYVNNFKNVIAGRIDRQKVKLEYFNFTDEYDEWYFDEYLSSIADFKYKNSNLNGYLEVWVETWGGENNQSFEKPQEFQENAFTYFIENQEKVLSALCNGIIENYPKLMEIYKVEEYNETFGFPELKSIDDVKKIISINYLNVLGEEKDNFGYLGFACGCSWDEEHGARVTMYKDRVVSIDHDSSYYAYEEILKDKLTEEEWNNYIESQEKQKAASLAKHYEEQALIEKEKQEKEKFAQTQKSEIKTQNKKWWQFWKI